MSIVLKAFPMSFLISPDAKNHDLPDKKYDLSLESENLKLLKVSTNLTPAQISSLMSNFEDCTKIDENCYELSNGLNIEWKLYNGHYCAFLKMNDSIIRKSSEGATLLVKYGEILFNTLDVITRSNVRDIGAEEVFYYSYKTPYKTRDEILDLLYQNNIENISKRTETEIRFRVNNKNYKYIRNNKNENFNLESEQKISLVNIVAGKYPITSRTLKTNYTDKESLVKTLSEHEAVNIISDDYNITCELLGMKMHYSKDCRNSGYNLEITQIRNEEECSKILVDLEEEYALNVQDLTYRKIIERIKNKNMRLERESVEDDNTIVLTIDVG